MNRIRIIAAAVLLLGVTFLVGGCKKCECGNDSGNGGNNGNGVTVTAKFNCSPCAEFTDELKPSGNSVDHRMKVELSCVSDSDTSYLELDGIRIKEFYGHDSDWVSKNVAHGTHHILCFTLGTMDTVVDVTFTQNNNIINWSTSNGLSISTNFP